MRSCELRRAVLAPPGILAVSFLAGAVPFSNLAAYRLRGVDLRRLGTGTVSATGVWQIAGLGPLAVTGILDVAKGTVGPLLAGRQRPALAATACGVAVAGHNWSPFLGGSGGRGLSVAIGGLAATQPAGAIVLLAGLGLGKLAGQTGLGCLAADIALVPVLRRTAGKTGVTAAWAVLIPMIAKRLLGNGPAGSPATYLARLLFDRDKLRERAASAAAPATTAPGTTPLSTPAPGTTPLSTPAPGATPPGTPTPPTPAPGTAPPGTAPPGTAAVGDAMPGREELPRNGGGGLRGAV